MLNVSVRRHLFNIEMLLNESSHEKPTLREPRLKGQSALFWVSQNSTIIIIIITPPLNH